jgi:transcriptional regulator GlxA family with amidase domain
MDIAFLLFDRITALDAVGPYEVLSRLPNAEVRFVASEPGPKRTDTGSLVLFAEHSLGAMPHPDIIVVPGGPGTRNLLRNKAILEWIREAHRHSRWTTSVCTGALLLGAAGILNGLRATTHWRALADLANYGAQPTKERVVEEGKVITAAGVSAGIDMALHLARIEAGDEFARALQLVIEYDPQPPFDSGSRDRASDQVVETALGVLGTRATA